MEYYDDENTIDIDIVLIFIALFVFLCFLVVFFIKICKSKHGANANIDNDDGIRSPNRVTENTSAVVPTATPVLDSSSNNANLEIPTAIVEVETESNTF